MSDVSAAQWKKALTFIREELDKNEYWKLLNILEKIPKGKKNENPEQLPQMIIEYYGLEGSIAAIDDAMQEIPRRDPKIQDRLQPFVEKLKANEKEKKKKCEHLSNKSVVLIETFCISVTLS